MRPVVFFALLASASVSSAQNIPQGQDVADRRHPDYGQVGIDVGGFTILPSVTTTVAATNNYLANDVERKANVGLLLRPDLTWRSKWGRHRVNGNLFFEQRVNTLQRENSSTYGITVNGVYDFSRESNLRLGGVAMHLVEDRRSLNSFQLGNEPVLYDVLQGEGVFNKDFGSFELEGRAGIDRLDYHDAETSGGQSISQDFRDYTAYTLGTSGQYKLRNGIGVIVTARHVKNDYDFGPGSPGFVNGLSLQRDSSGTTIQGGITLELSNLIFGTIQAGHLWRNYKDPRISDVSSASFSANLLWNVTPLTSLTGSARRWVEESASFVSAGNIRSDLRLGVHHELYRHVLLTGDVDLSRFKPVSQGSSGSEYSAVLGARYLMSRRATFNGQLRYSRRDSDNIFQRYDATEARFSFRYGI